MIQKYVVNKIKVLQNIVFNSRNMLWSILKGWLFLSLSYLLSSCLLRQDVFSCFDLLIFLLFEGLFSWREDDPSTRKIVEGRWIILAPYCSVFDLHVACSRLRDSGEKLFSKKKCEKRAGAGERPGIGAYTHFFNGLFRYISSWYTLWLANCDS